MPTLVTYNQLNYLLMTGLDLETADIRCLLVTSGYAVDADHDFVSDLVPASNEIQDASYTRATLTGKTVTPDDTNDRSVFSAADVPFGNPVGGETVAGAVFYLHVTNDTDSPLLWFQQISPAKTLNGGDVTLDVRSVGLLHLAQTAPADPGTEEDEVTAQWGEVQLSAGEADAFFDTEEADTDYIVVGLAGDADETFRVTEKHTTHIHIVSSNLASTATVGWEIREPQAS